VTRLYVLGARQRDLFLKDEEEWNLYEAALILEIDIESGRVRTCVEHETAPEARASESSSSVFKSGTLVGDILYTCTSTEVLIFQLPQFHQAGYISLPCFNDLHHVTPSSDQNLLAAVTGLDMVVKFDRHGRILAEWSVLPEVPWSRFSPTKDYRKVETTKPHKSHPNFVFELGDQVWATRFRQRDAVCVADLSKRIEIGLQSPHDGLLFGDDLYFTTVDGQIVVVDATSLKIRQRIDLKTINGHEALLGWCRGLLPVHPNRLWVGFTRIRKTRFKENVLWVRSAFREGMREKPTHISLYDLKTLQCLQEFDLERHGMNIIFSIFPTVSSKDNDFQTTSLMSCAE